MSNKYRLEIFTGVVAAIGALAGVVWWAWSAVHWLVIVIAGGIVLWVLYLLYHQFQIRRLTRKKIHQEVKLVETEKWEREQVLLLEHMKLELEREKMLAEVEMNRWRVLVPQGHTVVFPAEDYHSIASHAPAQIARTGKGDVIDADARRPIQVPEAYDLIDVFRRGDVAKDHIFLGKTEEGNVTVNAYEQLCHGVFNAITGRGKTIVERGIEMQLLKAGHEVIHADIKFTLIDEKGLDYRPIAKALLDQGLIDGCSLPHLLMDAEQIRTMIEWAALTEVPRRLALYHAGIHSYKTLYIFLEEFLYLVRLYPEIAGWVETLIIVGRSLGIKIFTVAQNFLAKDTKLSGAMRENFETAYYLGGDDHSGAVILDMGKKELMQFLGMNNILLGKGLAMIRNNTVAPQARLIRTGWASNDALYYLLGRADNFKLPGTPSGLYGTPGIERSRMQSWQSLGQKTLVVESSSEERHTGPLPALPKNGLDGLVEQSGMAADGVPVFGPEDYILDELQIKLFCTYYEDCGNIADSLSRIKNDKGQGLGRRYFKHASWIVKQKNLKRSN